MTDTNDDPTDGLSILGATVRRSISADELETFATPTTGINVVVFESNEFVCSCPLTQQPDHYRLSITYGPRAKCLESKSLKLYLWGFAAENRAAFAETLAAELADDLAGALDPAWLKVRLEQGTRGGIVTKVVAERGALAGDR